MLNQFNEIRFTYAHFSDAFVRFVAYLRSSVFYIFCAGSAFDNGAWCLQIFRLQQKKLGRFRTFLPLFCDLECGNNRMALWFKKSGRKPFYDGRCISGIGQFFPVFIGFPMLSLVQKCTGNLLGIRISDRDLDEL